MADIKDRLSLSIVHVPSQSNSFSATTTFVIFCFFFRFADVLQTRQQSVAYFGKRCEVALELSNQQWHNSDKEVRSLLPLCSNSLHVKSILRLFWLYEWKGSFSAVFVASLSPSGVGVVQENNPQSISVRAAVLFLFRPYSTMWRSSGAAPPQGESWYCYHLFWCCRLTWI